MPLSNLAQSTHTRSDCPAHARVPPHALARARAGAQGYPVDAPGEANMLVCSNAITEAFDAPAMTLEMPFKDNANRPDGAVGWSPARAMRLGASALDALDAVVDDLR